MYSNNNVKAITNLKKENEELQELINFLRMENFDYALKCNRIANIISNIKSITQDNPRKLSEASENLFSILQTYGTSNDAMTKCDNRISQITVQNKSVGKTEEVTVGSKKAQVVNPHSINGSVLYIPTINLTRISDIQMQSISNDQDLQHTIENKSNGTTNLNAFDADNVEPSTSTVPEQNSENELNNLDDVSDTNAKSPAHSTVLSGTFQEVKIFLNQISPKRRNEETRISNPKRQRTKSSKKNIK